MEWLRLLKTAGRGLVGGGEVALRGGIRDNHKFVAIIRMGGSNSAGGVIAFQAIGRGFESRLPLQVL